MNEYISREEAIKELREVYEYEYPTASGDFDEYASHDVPNVLRNMPAADVQPVNQWISVKDRLPPVEDLYSNMTCICCTKNGRVLPLRYVCTIVRKKKVYRWEMMNGSLWGNDVAYWQPLPEPPKDGEQNEWI